MEEVDLQARMVEDLDKDFSHTQERMKKLRTQGFKLAGEKNEAWGLFRTSTRPPLNP